MAENEDSTATIEEDQNEDVQTTEAGDTTEYTIDKQELDQERSNTRRAKEELASVTGLYETQTERVESLESELEEVKKSNEAEKARLEAQQQSEQDKLKEMDPDLVDSQVIKNIQALEARIKKQSEHSQKREEALLKKLNDVSNKAAQLENERAEMQRKSEHDKAVESVLSRVEASLKKHGVATPGQYRTEAYKLADDLVDKGERKKPENMLQGLELMEDCYLKVIAQHQKKKTGVSADDGKSGVTTGVKTKPERKTGSLDDVAADMAKDKSWKED